MIEPEPDTKIKSPKEFESGIPLIDVLSSLNIKLSRKAFLGIMLGAAATTLIGCGKKSSKKRVSNIKTEMPLAERIEGLHWEKGLEFIKEAEEQGIVMPDFPLYNVIENGKIVRSRNLEEYAKEVRSLFEDLKKYPGAYYVLLNGIWFEEKFGIPARYILDYALYDTEDLDKILEVNGHPMPPRFIRFHFERDLNLFRDTGKEVNVFYAELMGEKHVGPRDNRLAVAYCYDTIGDGKINLVNFLVSMRNQNDMDWNNRYELVHAGILPLYAEDGYTPEYVGKTVEDLKAKSKKEIIVGTPFGNLSYQRVNSNKHEDQLLYCITESSLRFIIDKLSEIWLFRGSIDSIPLKFGFTPPLNDHGKFAYDDPARFGVVMGVTSSEEPSRVKTYHTFIDPEGKGILREFNEQDYGSEFEILLGGRKWKTYELDEFCY